MAESTSPTLAIIAAVGSILTASLPVLISKIRERGQSVAVASPSASSPARNSDVSFDGGPNPGRHRLTTNAASLTAVIDDGSSMLNQLISDVQLRARAAEDEVRSLRQQNDQLESKLYEQRYGYEQQLATQRSEIQSLQAQVRAMIARGM